MNQQPKVGVIPTAGRELLKSEVGDLAICLASSLPVVGMTPTLGFAIQ